MKSKWISFAIFIFLCLSIEIIGGILTRTSVETWYPYLKKASFNPPPWIFGPVWSLLYLLIAVSGWLIFIQPVSQKRRQALYIYSAQLLVNLLWSYLFFYLQSPLLGLIDITILFGLIVWTLISFQYLSRAAAYLLIPYLLWTGYAFVLNAYIFSFN